jgi:SAM-dependent methyltransferase
MSADPWADRAFLRASQYKSDANLAARQSVYAYQPPRIDLAAAVLDLVGPIPAGAIIDVGCGNGAYLAELTKRGCGGRVLGVDLSPGMLAAARDRLTVPGHSSPGAIPAQPTETVAARPRVTPVALACADATALPLPDGAVGLALAPHMLYHVPDPADAVHELRRVVRPGGRVVIVLNGPGHLRQLRAAVAAARGVDPATLGERIRLDDGELMARSFFSRATRHDFVAELRVPGPGPIVDYLRSMSGTSHGVAQDPPAEADQDPPAAVDRDHTAAVDQDPTAEMVAATFPRNPDGHYIITSHAGCLVCEVD